MVVTDTQAIAVTVTNATPNETVTGDGDPNTFLGADKEAFFGQGGSDTVSYATASAAVTANLASSPVIRAMRRGIPTAGSRI